MFPNQMTALARHYTQMTNEQRAQAVRHDRADVQTGAIRKRTGWTLVHIGLRIAASASR
jgi:hypothetical protein